MGMKIRTKIFLFTTLFIIICSSFIGIFIIDRIHKNMLEDEITSALADSNSITSSVNYLLQNKHTQGSYNDDQTIDYITSYLYTSNNRTKKYLLLDNEGISIIRRNNEIVISKENLRILMNGKKTYSLNKSEEKYLLNVYTPVSIYSKDFIIASRTDLTSLVDFTKENYRILIITFMLIGSLVLLCTYIFSKLITNDISKLISVSKEITDGNYHITTDIKSKDEIGELANNFDLMSEEINTKVSGLNEEVLKTQKLFSNLTHEIKTPLTSVIGYADLLRQKEYDKELFDKGLSHIYLEGKRLSKLSAKLIQIIDLNKSSLKKKYHGVDSLIDECIEVNKHRTYGKDIEFRTDLEEVEILVDKEVIKNVLINVIDNAIKASEDTAIIYITAKQSDNMINLVVEDFGIGMSKEEIGYIFEPFYKIDKSRGRDGLGLGLSLSKDIMTMHDGTIEVSSTLNKGTKVNLNFTTPLHLTDKLSINR
ncbi:MAG: HAMP domain-containing histidine kinase [Clostridiales bacterium]|nr:HAMP domain-containing histidine kinase [Clostridiales bacterium]